MPTTKQSIEQALTNALNPSILEVEDDSHRHRNHPGAKESGGGHFNLLLVAECFAEKNMLERHRQIYEALGTLMQTHIHALAIKAYTPEEWQQTTN